MTRTWSVSLVLLALFWPLEVLTESTGVSLDSRAKSLLKEFQDRVKDPGDETKPGSGTTYYVSLRHGDDSRDCKDRDKPCKTGNRVESLNLKPCDTVLFERNNRWEDDHLWLINSESGKEGCPITYGAYGSGSRPHLWKKSKKDTNVNRRSYIVLDRLDLSGMQALRYRSSTHHIDHYYTRIWNSGNACILIAGKKDVDEPHNIRFFNSSLENCGTSRKNGEGLYVSHSADVSQRGGRDILFKDGMITGVSGEPINVKYLSRRVVVDRTLIFKNKVNTTPKKDPGLWSGLSSTESDAGHVLKNSLLIDNVGFDNEHNAALLLGKGTSAFNNIIVNNKNMYCIRGLRGSKAYNNTCIGNSKGFFTDRGGDGGRDPSIELDDVKCNIGGDKGNNINASESMFVDLSQGDYRLKKRNDQMGGGCGLNGTMKDFLGRDRPKSGWSFGAIEYTGDEPPEPPENPAPVSIGWCVCGCTEGKEGMLGDIHHVEECKDGCAMCPEEGGVNIPMEKDTVIGPVLH